MERISRLAERVAAQSVYYHVTARRNVGRIRREGIRAPAYVWDSVKMASFFKRMHEDKEYADDAEPMEMVAVNLSGLEKERDSETDDMSYWDDGFRKGQRGGGWIVKEGVGPDRIL